MISVIIRTRNESAWIRQCLYAVSRQDFLPFEIVVVDNASEDSTLEIVRGFGGRIVPISRERFSYGRALNEGIRRSEGEWICCLSGHCIPEDANWLFRLHMNFRDPEVAGVYGRQKPLSTSHAIDKRDLWTLFGPERRIQTKDPFFHNANSMIRRSVWSQVPFDEAASGLEDRLWARRVLELGHTIVYEPSASVYHPHGVNHAGDVARAERVVKTIEEHRLYGD